MTKQFETRQFMNRETLEVFHYEDSSLEAVPLHHHDFYELILFIRGNVDYRVETEVFPLKSGDLILVPCGIFHQPLIRTDEPYERIVLWINRNFLETGNSGEIDSCFRGGSYVYQSKESYERIYTLLRMLKEGNREDRLQNDYEKAVLTQILIECDRLQSDRNIVSSSETEDPFIANILEYLGSHYLEDISLDSLSSSLGFSKYYIAHRFKEEMGTSVYQYILSKRLIRAHDLLVSGNRPQETAVLSGFKDYVNFYRSFRNEFGLPPSSVYRNSHL